LPFFFSGLHYKIDAARCDLSRRIGCSHFEAPVARLVFQDEVCARFTFPSRHGFSDERLPIFRRISAYGTCRALAWLRVRVELLTVVFDHFWVRFPAGPKAAVWPGVLMAYGNQLLAAIKWIISLFVPGGW